MSQYIPDDSDAVPIDRYEQLVGFFEAGCKPRSAWRIGTEWEKVAVRPDGHAVPFSGRAGIEAFLQKLADRFAWEPLLEDGRLIALRRDGASITLEPGAQVELSGAALQTVHETAAELRLHLAEILAAAEGLDITFLGLGMQPISRLDEIEWVPKRRYRIMGPYMERVGTLGHRMMKQTATVQVNLDFGSEADAIAKMRAGMGVAPLLSAMFANSPLCDGDLNGYLTFRGHVWTDTDNARSGLLPFIFEPSASFARYVDYALDVPMYFIVRDAWIDMTAYTFRRFLAEGHAGHRATMEDWATHLTTLFPETRLKRYIELRSADSQAPERIMALPALAKGILYDEDCLMAAWDLVKGWPWAERLRVWSEVYRGGMAVKVGRVSIRDLCVELLAIAEHGLRRQAALDERGNDETRYLARLSEDTRSGRCPADWVRSQWLGAWRENPRVLVAGTAFRADGLDG